MTAFTVNIDHPDGEKILRAAIEGYGKIQEVHARYITESQPRGGENKAGQKRRATVHTDRAVACFGATITPGGQAGPTS